MSKSATTTGFVQPSIPDTTYRTGVIVDAPLKTRLIAKLHLLSLLFMWFVPVLSPIIWLVMLWIGYYTTTAIFMTIAAIPYLFPGKASLWYRWYVCRAGNTISLFKKGFTVYYTHGSYELMNRKKRADYLQYDIDQYDVKHPENKNRDPTKPLPHHTNVEVLYPDDEFTQNYSKEHKTINISKNWESEPYREFNEETRKMLKKPFLVVIHPHGLLCCGGNFGLIVNKSFDNINTTLITCVADNLTKSPYFAYIENAYNKLTSAKAENMKKLMKNGQDLGLFPGGFQEASATKYGTYHMFIKKRQGFIKYALQFGYNLVPFFCFGEELIYHNLQGFDNARQWLADRNIPSIVPWGQYGTLIPYTDNPLFAVFGKPVFLPHIEHPNSDEVEYWHKFYMERVQELFDEYLHKLKLDKVPGDKQLHVY